RAHRGLCRAASRSADRAGGVSSALSHRAAVRARAEELRRDGRAPQDRLGQDQPQRPEEASSRVGPPGRGDMSGSTADLRSFLAPVRKARPSDVLDVAKEVDPSHETAAILTKLEEKQRSPILVFQYVTGCPWPLVTNVCGSMGRLALALGCGLKEVTARYAA